MKITIDTEKIPECEPQKYSGKKYIIHSEELGEYTKKEAETIAYFIKFKLINLFDKIKSE